MIKTENFSINTILSNDELGNEEYHKCINEDANLYYKTNAKYGSCYKVLNNLTNWGMPTNTNIGFGPVNETCQIESLKKQPSSCLEKHIKNQNTTLSDINKLYSNTTSNEILFRNKINKNISDHSTYLDNLYKDKEIKDIINYLYLYSYPVSDPIYNSILINKNIEKNGDGATMSDINQNSSNSTSPTTTSNNNTTQKVNNKPKTLKEIRKSQEKTTDSLNSNSDVLISESTPGLTPPAIIFANNTNMNLSKTKNTSGILGY